MNPLLFALLLALVPPRQAEPSGPPKLPPYDAAWTREAWTADEAPYLEIRREAEAYVLGRSVSRTRTDLMVQTERALAVWRPRPKDPVALYRAAYYAYELGGFDLSPEARTLLRASRIDMASVPSPHSREYDRLRMLREAFLNGVFLDLGERLYKRDPDDLEVALKLAWINDAYGPGSRKRALEIATRLLRTGDPKAHPAIYYVYGSAHHYMRSTEKTREHLDQAKWGYRQYIAAGPEWRPKAIDAKAALGWLESSTN